MDKQTVNKIFSAMWSEQEQCVAAWRDLSRFLAPMRGIFQEESRTDKNKNADYKTILDSAPCYAVEILAAGMMSGLTSPSRSWFVLEMAGKLAREEKDVDVWLDSVKERMERVFAQSNIYSVLHNFYMEIAVFGTAAFLLEEERETGLRCVPLTIGEYALDVDGKGKVNRFARKFKLTAAQLQGSFGKDNLPLSVKTALNNHQDAQEFNVYHVIVPNDVVDVSKKDNRNMPFASYYWTENQQDGFLRRGGYEEFPVIAARWEVKNNTDVYGKGIGHRCLGDVKMLQKMQKTKLVALDKATNPPMMVSSNVQGEVNLLPGGLTRYSGTTDAAIKPVYQIQPDLKSLEFTIEQTKKSIFDMFHASTFLMISEAGGSNMTATEVAERHQEKMLVLGPVLERLKNELLDPLIERTFAILYRTGCLPEVPEELEGGELQVKYVSMIAQAQQSQGVQIISQGVNFAASLATVQAQLGQSAVMDGVDFDAALKAGYKALGVPAVMTRSDEEVQALREERAQAMRAAQEAQQTQALVQGAKTLSDTKLGQGSALDALTGAAG